MLVRDGVDLCKFVLGWVFLAIPQNFRSSPPHAPSFRVVNKRLKNEVKYHSPAAHPYKQMDNIGKFVASCAILGVGQTFDVGDLHQNRNWPRVLATLRALARIMEAGPTAAPPKPLPPVAHPPPKRRPVTAATATGGSLAALPSSAGAGHAIPWAKERAWLGEVLRDAELSRLDAAPPLVARLKSGVLLCRLANLMEPGAVPSSVYQGRVTFLQAQNIELYLRACAKAGVAKPAMFEVGDLQEERNVPLVMANIAAVSAIVCARPGYSGPGPLAPPIGEKPAVDEAEASKPAAAPEEKTLVDWANTWLLKAKAQPLRNLSADVRSGVKLIQLACALSGARPLAPCRERAKTAFECAQNAAILISFVEQ
jgi:hypothetical protein